MLDVICTWFLKSSTNLYNIVVLLIFTTSQSNTISHVLFVMIINIHRSSNIIQIDQVSF